MRKLIILLLLLWSITLTFGQGWPQFRGPTGQGHSVTKVLPLNWNREKGVAWEKKLSGKAWSSPICVNDQIFLTNAVLNNESLVLEVISIDFNSGQIKWRKKIFEYDQQPRIHKKNSYASPTPFFDDNRIFVHFGNLGTACLGVDGELIWTNKLDYLPVHGSGASPVIYEDLLLLSADGASNPYLYALDKKSGEIKWKVKRDSQAKKNFSFCTPLVVQVNGEVQIISPASDYVFAYDLRGNQLWKFNYPNGYSVVPRPVFDEGIIYVSSGYDSPIFYAIKCGGRGDLTKKNLVWKTRKGAPRNSSVIVINGLLFMVADNGVVSCLDSKTGELFWMERVAGSCSPSLIHSNGKILLSDEMGKTFIFKASKSYKLLATNDIEERMLASPIVFKNSLLLRTENSLWRIDP